MDTRESPPTAAPPPPGAPRTGLRRSGPGPWIGAAVAVALAAAALFLLNRPGGTREAPEPAPVAAAPAAAPSEPPPPAPAPPADPRTLLEAVSTSALFRSAVQGEEGIRRWAAVTDNLAEGESPRKALAFLAPGRPFSVTARDGRTSIAAGSYARYDGFAALVDGVDAQAAARAYRALHGPVEAAYRALGYPDGSLDRATARALGRIIGAPAPQGDVEVVDEGGIYTFADPKLEDLDDVEKHLVRMGPRNERLIQAKARELLKALGLQGP
ncbi:MAG TPA: DUF3014 domain-containing protein [Anaeromyxobacteraceae bacterium]|nr:DUF3014 domain-containing protein [Anaeromyxobacteraceae bacterium]